MILISQQKQIQSSQMWMSNYKGIDDHTIMLSIEEEFITNDNILE